jgi:hypothetical protein
VVGGQWVCMRGSIWGGGGSTHNSSRVTICCEVDSCCLHHMVLGPVLKWLGNNSLAS